MVFGRSKGPGLLTNKALGDSLMITTCIQLLILIKLFDLRERVQARLHVCSSFGGLVDANGNTEAQIIPARG